MSLLLRGVIWAAQWAFICAMLAFLTLTAIMAIVILVAIIWGPDSSMLAPDAPLGAFLVWTGPH